MDNSFRHRSKWTYGEAQLWIRTRRLDYMAEILSHEGFQFLSGTMNPHFVDIEMIEREPDPLNEPLPYDWVDRDGEALAAGRRKFLQARMIASQRDSLQLLKSALIRYDGLASGRRWGGGDEFEEHAPMPGEAWLGMKPQYRDQRDNQRTIFAVSDNHTMASGRPSIVYYDVVFDRETLMTAFPPIQGDEGVDAVPVAIEIAASADHQASLKRPPTLDDFAEREGIGKRWLEVFCKIGPDGLSKNKGGDLDEIYDELHGAKIPKGVPKTRGRAKKDFVEVARRLGWDI